MKFNKKNLKNIKGDASFRSFYRKRNNKKKTVIVYSSKEKEKNLLIYDAINKLLIRNKILAPKLFNENYNKNFIEIEDFGNEWNSFSQKNLSSGDLEQGINSYFRIFPFEKVDHDSVVWDLNPNEEQLHRLWSYYLANVTMIDEKIGSLLKSLDDKGYLENAVVIFTSDHGDSMGDHGQIEKWTMYDEIVRVPCVFWSKNSDLLTYSGRNENGLCQLFDLGPTILEYAGIEGEFRYAQEDPLGAGVGPTAAPTVVMDAFTGEMKTI